MDVSLIKEFLVFSKTLNYSTAAKELFIAQSTLSKHIAKIEGELGYNLVTHNASPRLTAAGKTFAANGAEVVDAFERLMEKSGSAHESELHRIRIADLRMSYDLLDDFKLLKAHSYCIDFIREAKIARFDPFESLDGGKVDFTFTCSPDDNTDFFDDVDANEYGFVKIKPITIMAGLAIGNPLSDPGGITMEKMSSLKIAFDTQPLWKRGEEAVLEILKRSGFEITHTWSHGSSKMNLVEKDFTRGFTTWKIVANNVGYLYEDSFDIIPIIGHDATLYAWAVYRKDNPNPQVSKFAESWQAIAKAREGAD